jgi:hypothetical protein
MGTLVDPIPNRVGAGTTVGTGLSSATVVVVVIRPMGGALDDVPLPILNIGVLEPPKVGAADEVVLGVPKIGVVDVCPNSGAMLVVVGVETAAVITGIEHSTVADRDVVIGAG